jgi:hypothetical protein
MARILFRGEAEKVVGALAYWRIGALAYWEVEKFGTAIVKFFPCGTSGRARRPEFIIHQRPFLASDCSTPASRTRP